MLSFLIKIGLSKLKQSIFLFNIILFLFKSLQFKSYNSFLKSSTLFISTKPNIILVSNKFIILISKQCFPLKIDLVIKNCLNFTLVSFVLIYLLFIDISKFLYLFPLNEEIFAKL